MKRFLGFFVFAMGLWLAGWIGYNLLIERLPETQGQSPIPGILFSLGMLFFGFKWMKGESAG